MYSDDFINEILKDWAQQIENGKPDPTDCNHLVLLSQVLYEMNFSTEFVGEFIGNLNIEQGNICEINSDFATEILDPLLEGTGSYDFRHMGGGALTGAFGGDASGDGGDGGGAVGGESVEVDDDDDEKEKNEKDVKDDKDK